MKIFFRQLGWFMLIKLKEISLCIVTIGFLFLVGNLSSSIIDKERFNQCNVILKIIIIILIGVLVVCVLLMAGSMAFLLFRGIYNWLKSSWQKAKEECLKH